MDNEQGPHAHDGHAGPNRVEIADTIVVERCSPAFDDEEHDEQEYEVVGIVEGPDGSLRYAVCYCESDDEFIVTDDGGALLEDHELAQEILNDFLDEAHPTEEDN